MSGQPTPPRIIEAFAINAAGAYITKPFPTPSQISITPGAASLNDGFPPLCFLDPADGGVLPSGADYNGILYLISAWACYFAAGQLPAYDGTLQTAMTGYALGARITQAANPAALWINLVDGNTTDPDTGGAGWLSTVPLYSTAVLSGSNNVVLPGVSDYLIDVDCSGGAVNYTGFVAQRDGQKITFCKSDSSANALTLAALSGSSSSANRVRAAGPVTLPAQYLTATIQYFASLGKWVPV